MFLVTFYILINYRICKTIYKIIHFKDGSMRGISKLCQELPTLLTWVIFSNNIY